MRTLFKALYLMLLLLAVGCGKIELDEAEEPESSGQGESGGTETPGETGEALSVAGLLQAEETDQALVAGYIVGSVAGTSLSHAVFGTDGAAISNLLIADSPDVTDRTLCAPVELRNGSEFRAELNLADNPEMLGAHILFCGNVRKYFSVMGLKGLSGYEFIEEPDPVDPPVEIPFPTLSADEAEVFEGC